LQGSTEDNLIDFTPELKQRATEQLQQFEHGPIYTPPSEKGTLFLPGVFGGANWGGGAFDPETRILYVPARMAPSLSRLAAGDPKQTNFRYSGGGGGRPGQPNLATLMQIEGLSIFKPPYAKVTAIDMNKGVQVWTTPLRSGRGVSAENERLPGRPARAEHGHCRTQANQVYQARPIRQSVVSAGAPAHDPCVRAPSADAVI
jgi:quinoprotein glucose dehydrogenase